MRSDFFGRNDEYALLRLRYRRSKKGRKITHPALDDRSLMTSLMPWSEDMMRAMNEARDADAKRDYVTVRQLMRSIQSAAGAIIETASVLEANDMVYAERLNARREYLARMAANYTEPPTF